jgi:predicted dithiol-disulfide oxidoreductase (DUF899 family)
MARIKTMTGTRNHPVVSHDEWVKARVKFLQEEKNFTKLRDELNERRRELPWEKVDKAYSFDGPDGAETLPALFGGMGQLIVWHFMFGSDWKEGCSHCSCWADTFNAVAVHLRARDTTMAAVSMAPLKNIEAFKKRMGWTFKWVSAENTDFNYDFQASARPEELKAGKVLYNYREIKPFSDQMHGCSAFIRDDKGDMYHTYSTYARGVEALNGAFHYLDITAKGRDEDWSKGDTSHWIRHHDKYDI